MLLQHPRFGVATAQDPISKSTLIIQPAGPMNLKDCLGRNALHAAAEAVNGSSGPELVHGPGRLVIATSANCSWLVPQHSVIRFITCQQGLIAFEASESARVLVTTKEGHSCHG